MVTPSDLGRYVGVQFMPNPDAMFSLSEHGPMSLLRRCAIVHYTTELRCYYFRDTLQAVRMLGGFHAPANLVVDKIVRRYGSMEHS